MRPPVEFVRFAVTVALLLVPLISPRTQEADRATVIRVRTAQAAAIPVGGAGLATGVVRAFRKATVAAELPGRIVERLVEPGTIAKAGQALVRIDPERPSLRLEQARAMAQARKVAAEHAKHEYLRGKRLLTRKVVSQDTVDDLRFAERSAQAQLQAALVEVASAQRDLRDAVVKAPFAGQIEVVHVQVGDYVNPGQPIITQTDFSKARVIAGVTSREASLIKPGDTAVAVFEDLGGTSVTALISSVGRVRDPVTGTYPVELILAQESLAQLREGMIAMVSWQSAPSETSRLSVPSAALVRQGGQIRMYVVEHGRAYARNVRIGKSDGQRVEVLSGLDLGDWVVIEGQFALRDGAAVEASGQPAT